MALILGLGKDLLRDECCAVQLALADEMLGILTEDRTAWIGTEDGFVIRTEDQPQKTGVSN